MGDEIAEATSPDYTIQIRVKNARIYRRIMARSPSVSVFCKANGLPYSEVIAFIGMKKSPRRADGEWRDCVYDLSSALRVEPEELFNERQQQALSLRTYETDVDEDSLIRAMDVKKIVSSLLGLLSDRSRYVIERRMDGATLDDISREMVIHKERVRQIEMKAMRTMGSRLRIDQAKAQDALSSINPTTKAALRYNEQMLRRHKELLGDKLEAIENFKMWRQKREDERTAGKGDAHTWACVELKAAQEAVEMASRALVKWENEHPKFMAAATKAVQLVAGAAR